jgi:protein-tyrosine phosphatase
MSGKNAVLWTAFTLVACSDVVSAHRVGPGGSDSGGDSDATVCTPGSRVLPDVLTNARDLGGIPVGDAGVVACGELHRGAAPVGLTGVSCAQFNQLGIRTIIDLRTEAERIASPDSACVTEQAAMVLAPMPVPYNVSPADYLADLNATDAVLASFDVFGDVAAYPIFFHCVYGRDRTGVLAAIVLLALGVTRDDVMTEYQLSATAGVGAYPESLDAVLDEIEQLGGVETYLAAIGVSAAELATLRTRAIVSLVP